MSDDMLICFDSPAVAKAGDKAPNRNGLSSPLIPCPSTPFDLVSSRPGDDPFELGPQNPFGAKKDARFNGKMNAQEPCMSASLVLDIPALDAATPSPLLLRRAMSDVDISGVVPGQYLVSSTPLVSNANTPTRSSRSAPRRSVLCVDESISCALVKSKLDFINKVKQNLVVSDGNPGMIRSKSISNLTETHDTSVQHKIFSSTKSAISQERGIVSRGCHSINLSPPMDCSKVSFSSFMRDPDEFAKHETSTLLSFLTSPKHVMIGTTVSPEELCKEAAKMQFLFSLCASDEYDPAKEEEGCEWINTSCLPNAWFDDSLDLDNIHANDSDEDINVTKYAKRMSNQEEMEAIKIRLNRFRRSTGPDEDKLIKEPKEEIRTVGSDPPGPAASGCVKGAVPAPGAAAAAVDVLPAEAPPEAVQPLVVPKLPIVPEVRTKAPNPVPPRKGPLKAVEPVPNMIKKSHSSDMLKTKPALARGRVSRPSTEQGPRRQDSRRSNSISPHRTASTPPVKSLRPPLKLRGIKAKSLPATGGGGKGKENRA